MSANEADATATVPTVGRLLFGSCVAAGMLVLAGFFFPQIASGFLSGEYWVALSLLFFGSALGYLAVLPYDGQPFRLSETVGSLRARALTSESLEVSIRNRIDPLVVGTPIVVFVGYFTAASLFPAQTQTTVRTLRVTALGAIGPLLQIIVLLAVVGCVIVIVGKWGDIRLGGPDAKPAYSYPTYFTLIFTAGIAAGIVFWGPAEALFHYRHPPPMFDIAPESAAAAHIALITTLFHWGVSAWSAYAMVGIPVAYVVYEHDAPLRFSSILLPILGADGLESPWSRGLDTLAVLATIGGVGTSIALLSKQFLAGIAFHWGLTQTNTAVVIFVIGLTGIYAISAASGLQRGIRRIAAVNIGLFVLFAVVLTLVGPITVATIAQTQTGTNAIVGYTRHFLTLSLGAMTSAPESWATMWTVWNWAWWFSWAPFAGLFIAAISRGRRLRTVVATAVGATSMATLMWFLVFTQVSLTAQRHGTARLLTAVAARGGDEAVVGFTLLSSLPLADFLLFIFLALIIVFIVTSADTATLITAFLGARRGITPSRRAMFLWAGLQALVAIGVTLFGGGSSLQTLTVLTGAPIAVIAMTATSGVFIHLARDNQPTEYTALWTKISSRLPHVQQHHDIDPPGQDEDSE